MMPPFTRDKLTDYGEVMIEVASRPLEAWPQRGRFDLRQEMVLLSLQVAMSCLFGIDLKNRDAQEFAGLCMRYLGLVFSPGAMLFPVALPGTPYRRYLDTCDDLVTQLRRLIVRKREEGMGKDALSALIRASDEDPEGMTEDELVGQIDLLLIAGHETTAMTLTWSLLLLAAHPVWQEAVVDEVTGALQGAAPTVADLPRMPLLGRVVDETLRLLPPTPLLFFRRGTRDFDLAERRLPAGSTLVLSPLLTHRQAEIYPRANRFDPERWQGQSPGAYAYLPFGAGPRRCLGAGFAAQAIRLVLALVLQRRRLTVPSGVRVDFKVAGVVMGPSRGPTLELAPPGAVLAPPQPVGGSVRELVDL
ncbi:MAG: cytochrome P450, partial [Myxococcales bacterium]|nr:cytochrome P450 [Myxococcales bacterium]